MSELVTLTRDGEVAVITVNNPPVNALSPGVPEGIAKAIAEVAADDSIKGAVMIGAGQTFIAGADIKEFTGLKVNITIPELNGQTTFDSGLRFIDT